MRGRERLFWDCVWVFYENYDLNFPGACKQKPKHLEKAYILPPTDSMGCDFYFGTKEVV